MGLQRANWLEQQLSRYKKTAILKGIKSGALSQMRWTNLSFGLTPGCSRELHNPQKAIACCYPRSASPCAKSSDCEIERGFESQRIRADVERRSNSKM